MPRPGENINGNGVKRERRKYYVTTKTKLKSSQTQVEEPRSTLRTAVPSPLIGVVVLLLLNGVLLLWLCFYSSKVVRTRSYSLFVLDILTTATITPELYQVILLKKNVVQSKRGNHKSMSQTNAQAPAPALPPQSPKLTSNESSP